MAIRKRLSKKRQYRKGSKKRSNRKQRGGTKISFNAGEVIKVGTRNGTNLARNNQPQLRQYPKKTDAQELTQGQLNSLNLNSTIKGKKKSDLTFVMFPSGCNDILGVPKTLVN